MNKNKIEKMQDFEMRLISLIGSKKGAAKAMKFFSKVASKVPFSIEKIVEAGIKLESSGISYKECIKLFSVSYGTTDCGVK